MNPRTNYEMAEKDLEEIMEACKPTPVMFLSGGASIGGSQQENANDAWAKLGKKMGFDSMTVKPSNKGQRFFTAVSSETDVQKQAREQRQAEEKRQAQLKELQSNIELEIADAFSQSPNLSLDDLINQFTEDLDFDALIGWADLFGIDHDYKSWFDDDYPDKESELRGQLAEAMNKVGKKPEIS